MQRVGGSARGAAVAAVISFAAGNAVAEESVASLSVGDIFAHCEVFCPEMRLIRGGVFDMGSPPEEYGRDSDEGPVREVEVAPFAIAIAETSFTLWDACVADGFCRKLEEDLAYGLGRGRRPVVGVSWRDIVGQPRFLDKENTKPAPPTDGFLAWLNAKVEGQPYRLPTEAEWEYAVRADTRTAFYTGDRISAADANFNPKPLVGPDAEGPARGVTVGVGGLPANPWGLFEMAGNVWEWVQDCYAPDYKNASETSEAYREPDCRKRVLRGGAFSTFEIGVRSANRYSFDQESALGSFGFRVVYDLSAAGYECDDALLRCAPAR